MKTVLKFLALFSAAAVPGAFAAEIAGMPLPGGIDAFDALAVLAGTLVVLTALADYSRNASPLAARRSVDAGAGIACASLRKSPHALAA